MLASKIVLHMLSRLLHVISLLLLLLSRVEQMSVCLCACVCVCLCVFKHICACVFTVGVDNEGIFHIKTLCQLLLQQTCVMNSVDYNARHYVHITVMHISFVKFLAEWPYSCSLLTVLAYWLQAGSDQLALWA